VQAAGDPKVAEFETKPLFDKAISFIPVGSDDVQMGFDYVTDKWLEDEQKRLDDKQTKENVKIYYRRNGQLMGLSDEWSKTHRTVDSPYFNPQQEVRRSASDGMENAKGVSGEQPK
jgi:hypothetical protein